MGLVALVASTIFTGGLARAQKYPAVQPKEDPAPAKPTPTPSPDEPPADDDDDDDSGDGAAELLPPATNPWYFTGGVGPTFFDLTRKPKNRFGRRGRLRIALDIGYHFSGKFEGPAIAFALDQGIDGDLYELNPAFKFLWDIQVVDDLAIYAAPFGKVGYALGAANGGPFHALNIGFGAEGRIVFKDFAMAYLRLVQIDTFFGDFFNELFYLHYSALIGGGLTF